MSMANYKVGLSAEDVSLFSEHEHLVLEMHSIVKETLKIQDVDMNAHFVNDLKCDSLDQAEIVMEIESKYGINVDDKALEKMHHVKDAVREALLLIKLKNSATSSEENSEKKPVAAS